MKPAFSRDAQFVRIRACIHRGTDLFFGKVTEKSIRCCYNGWTLDTDGRCVSQPVEPNDGGRAKNTLRQLWYPVEERYGFVFAYLGPPIANPRCRITICSNRPQTAGKSLRMTPRSPLGGSGYIPWNWLQHHENGLDPAHVPIVHEHQFPPMLAQSQMSTTFETRPDRIFSRGEFKLDGMMMNFDVEVVLPIVRVIPSPLLPAPRPDGKSDQLRARAPRWFAPYYRSWNEQRPAADRPDW